MSGTSLYRLRSRRGKIGKPRGRKIDRFHYPPFLAIREEDRADVERGDGVTAKSLARLCATPRITVEDLIADFWDR